ncbi:hypothetical protein ACFQV2_14845 [Actinokineospora soli]|uniref:META domain-containing protein n=1 Tax=Actinokineospora soli TaxID=1048753 RepID=A0ABW2TML7_9PSEU
MRAGVASVEETMLAVLGGKAELSTDGSTMTLVKGGKGIRLTAR